MRSDSYLGEPIPPQVLLSVLGEPDRLVAYLSQGYGPLPATRSDEPPDHLRMAVTFEGCFAEVQQAQLDWLAAADEHGPRPNAVIDPAEVAEPPAASPWAGVDAEERALVLTYGVALMKPLVSEIGLFRLSNMRGGEEMLVRLRAGMAAGDLPIDVVFLDHLLYAALTHRLLHHRGEAVVVSESAGAAWTLTKVFPPHAPVWRHVVAQAPLQHIGGLMFANLAELIMRALLARRTGVDPPTSAPVIMAALTAGGAAIASHFTNLLDEEERASRGRSGPGRSGSN